MFHDESAKLIADLAKTVLEEPKPEQFLAHMVNRTLASIEARGAILGIVEREGFLDLQGTYGYENELVEPYMRIPLWTPMPITDAARLGEINIFYSPRELVSKYPHLQGVEPKESGVTTSIPISFRNTVIGALGITSLKSPKEGFEFSDTTQAIMALAGLYVRNLMASRKDGNKSPSASMKSLTPRQKQIIQLFKEDLTTDQMAERLQYSSSTIKQDIIKIYSIFGVNNRMGVVKLAEKAGLS